MTMEFVVVCLVLCVCDQGKSVCVCERDLCHMVPNEHCDVSHAGSFVCDLGTYIPWTCVAMLPKLCPLHAFAKCFAAGLARAVLSSTRHPCHFLNGKWSAPVAALIMRSCTLTSRVPTPMCHLLLLHLCEVRNTRCCSRRPVPARNVWHKWRPRCRTPPRKPPHLADAGRA